MKKYIFYNESNLLGNLDAIDEETARQLASVIWEKFTHFKEAQ
jgi:hypothetical protein